MSKAGIPWSDEENDLTVASYFALFGTELSGRSVNKAEQYRILSAAIGREPKAIEFKFQNISAVLLGWSLPWISGLKPALNYQRSLEDAVQRWLEARPDWLQPHGSASKSNDIAESSPLWIGPAPAHSNTPPPFDEELLEKLYARFDPAARDAANRALGRAGELRVLNHERATLVSQGKNDLAERIRWISDEGDNSAGFDILSFEANGRERLIEVKTTNGWERAPFHISRNQPEVSERHAETWRIMRLYDFSRSPRAFELRPPLERHLALIASSYEARPH